MTSLAGYTLTQTLREDGETTLSRGRSADDASPVLLLSSRRPSPAVIERLEREYALMGELDPRWSVRPLALVRHENNVTLVLEDSGGIPLNCSSLRPGNVAEVLRVAIGLGAALNQVHGRGLIHKDIKPANVLLNPATGEVRLTGFGIATRLPRERQAPEPPAAIAGTLAYMAPEQTGRMNRSIDSRSDLYSLGVTLYELFTGTLPFTASEPMDWIHCHVARLPTPPAERNHQIPEQLSAVVMKLLAKTAEERYQTASGLEADLRRCLADFQASGRIGPFALAEHDVSARLLIPEKLYGRERESAALLAAWKRVVADGRPELLLVSGYSGVGKSSLVSELHKVIVLPRGLFASGKFDQYQRGTPYSTFARAFGVLIRQILVEPEDVVLRYRDAIREAVGPNGQLVVDLVPELSFVIGKQEAVPELSSQEAQNRYQAVFTRFLGVFARREHPLALFIDDMQWLDAASLKLLEHFLSSSEVRYLLLLGAYRDNEVTPSHPLMLTLDAIRRSAVPVHDVVLAPLSADDVAHLVADAVHCDRSQVELLAQVVYEKAAGNPFFTIQFLTALHDEGLLAFDGERWTWDVTRIGTMAFTDNVVELMIGKLRRLPKTTQDALKVLACLGHRAEPATLTRALGKDAEQVHADLWDAVVAGMLIRAADAYAFAHDRIQEAAHGLIPEPARGGEHLRIGRLLLSGATEQEVEEELFDLVDHFNRGLELITDAREKDLIRRLDFRAGRKAKAATAHASARHYFAQAMALLPADAWNQQYDDTFALTLASAECEYLVGNFARADELFHSILESAHSHPDRARAHRLRVNLYQVAGRGQDAVHAGLEGLALFGVTLPETEGELQATVESALQEFSVNLGERRIEDLVDAPVATDAEARAVLALIAGLVAPLYLTKSPLLLPLILKGTNVSLRFGNTEDSCLIYMTYAILRVGFFDDVSTAFELSEMALRLNERFNDAKLRGSLLFIDGLFIHSWRKPMATSVAILEQAFLASLNVGDFVYALHSAIGAIWRRVTAGNSIDQIIEFSNKCLSFAEEIHHGPGCESIRYLQQLLREIASFGHDPFDEDARLAAFGESEFSAGCLVTKQMAAVVYEQYDQALAYSRRAEAMLRELIASQKPQRKVWATIPVRAGHCFYHALTLAALYPGASVAEQAEFAATLAEIQKKLRLWAENCPENFACMQALVAAEVARIEGREPDAMRCYEQAIASACENGFVHIESMACERAAKFYLERGIERSAYAYLRDARAGYLRWSALGKVKQLDQRYPAIEKQILAPTATIGAAVEQLDVPNLIKASQAVSSEIVPEKLIEKLLAVVLAQAGAQRGLLALPHAEEFTIQAEATTRREGVEVLLVRRPPQPDDLPENILRYVVRTRENVILDDASAAGQFSTDPYVKRRQSKSILCLPLVKQAELVGVLYLENDLTPGAFTPNRVALLKVLASQAAISLESARLYSELVDERSRLQAVIRQVPAGLIIAEAPSGRLLIANERVEPVLHAAFNPSTSVAEYDAYVGFHADGRRYEATEWPLARSILHGETVDGEEIQMQWADGSRGWVSVNSAPIRDATGHVAAGVVMFQDITERKRREQALLVSEERFSKAFHNSPTPMAITRVQDDTFVDANEKCLRTFGYSREEFIGRLMPELGIAAPEQLEKAEQLLYEAGSFQDVEFVGKTKSGELRTLLTSRESIELGGERCLLTTFVDMTERKLVEAQLRQSQKMEAVGSLAGGIAHDFNNLLTVINGYSELAIMGTEVSDPNYELFESVLKAGERAAGLTRKLLAFSRKAAAESKDWSLNAIVSDMEGMLRRLIAEDVELVTMLAPDSGTIHADRSQVEQIILNLVVNARDAMPRGGTITIETHNVTLEQAEPGTLLQADAGPYVMLAVKDTGTGMTEEVKAKIFEPFFTTKEVGKGTGLGLSVVYGIVKESGGNISISSELGAGTTFRIDFPRVLEASAEATAAERPKSLGGNECILVAEDEDELRNFVTRALRFQGYRVFAVKNGREALQLLEAAEQPIDIVLTDVVMPVMGGRELAEQIRDQRPSMPILFMSGYSKDLDVYRWIKTAHVDFLPKPFRSSDLAKKVREVLERSWLKASGDEAG